MNTMIIRWQSEAGDMVPGYGTPKKGDVLIMDVERARSFIDRKMAIEYRRRVNGAKEK